MKVYVVERGERYEGGQAVGVYSTFSKAKAAALNQDTAFEDGWIEADTHYWKNGCDYVTVIEFEVDAEQE
jgi:hypothetical protein